MTRNAGQVNPTLSLQQNAERSAESKTTVAQFRHANRIAFNPFGNGQLRAFFDCAGSCATVMRGKEAIEEGGI